MRITVDPHRFTGSSLTTRALAVNDFAVEIDGLNVGRIMRLPQVADRMAWVWSINGPVLAHAGLNSSGETPSLAEARQSLREVWDRWLTWALASDLPVHWIA